MRHRKGTDKDGRGAEEELGGIEGRKIVISIYHIGKKNLLSIKAAKQSSEPCPPKRTRMVQFFTLRTCNPELSFCLPWKCSSHS